MEFFLVCYFVVWLQLYLLTVLIFFYHFFFLNGCKIKFIKFYALFYNNKISETKLQQIFQVCDVCVCTFMRFNTNLNKQETITITNCKIRGKY